MAYITGKFQHDEREIFIEVLQPTPDENDFERGLYTQIELESMQEFTPDELKELAAWLIETATFIEYNFNKDGSPKPSPTKTKHNGR